MNQAPPEPDLSNVPSACQFFRLTGVRLTSIRFWGSCFSSLGCVLDVAGSASRLSRATRRTVCLGKIAVMVRGESPEFVPVGAPEVFALSSQTLRERLTDLLETLMVIQAGRLDLQVRDDYFLVGGRPVYLNDTDFLDKLDFGPGSAGYVGVGYTNVRRKNLCKNENAVLVVAVTWATFGTLLVLMVATLCLRGKRAAPQKRERGGPSLISRIIANLKDVLGILTSLFMPVSVALNILVLVDVWGVWPMWVLLPCILGPFLVSGLLCSDSWTCRGDHKVLPRDVSVAWFWPPSPPEVDFTTGGKTCPSSLRRVAYTTLLWPLGVLATPALDVLGILGRLGVHLLVEGEPLSFRYYQEARSLLQIVLETLPQSVFQSALYILGSSRATRIYVDDEVFISSIAISLLGILFNIGLLQKEAIERKKGFGALVLERFAAMRRLARLEVGSPKHAQIVTDEKMVDESL